MLQIGNRHLEVEIDVERGADILRVAVPGEVNALAVASWSSPPATTTGHSYGASGLDWLSGYRGGWQELIPNAGAESELLGTPLPVHGEASVLPWRVLSASASACELQVSLRLPLTVTRHMAVADDRSALHVRTVVRNDSDLELAFVWGHHPVFPVLDGTRVHLPAGTCTPELRDADGDSPAAVSTTLPLEVTSGGSRSSVASDPPRDAERIIYLHGHSEGWAVVRQPAGQPHVALAWDVNALPALWLWQNMDHPGFPWFGRMRAIGVEPQRAWPYDGLDGARRRGQQVTVGPGASASSWMTMSIPDVLPESIGAVDRSGQVVDTAPGNPVGGAR